MTKAYPHYYKDFRCIAERCRHNCCIGWEIDIDRVTYKKYRRTPEILKTTRRDRHGAHFCTDERGRCLQLDERGRCRIIERFGEEFLPDICRLHPRFINERGSREETGLGLCCEEAARLIIKSKEPFSIIGDGDDEFCRFRRRALDLTADELPSLIGETWQTRPAAFWEGLFRSLERLSGEWDLLLDTLKEEPKDVAPRDGEFKNILSYFIFRHLKGEEIKKELFFCLLSYYIIEELYKRSDGSEGALLDIARQYSAEIEYSSYNLATLRDLF